LTGTPLDVDGGDAEGDYGTQDWVIINIPGVAFHPQWATQFGHFGNGAIHKRGGDTGRWFHVGFDLPEGVLLAGMTPVYYDSDATEDFQIDLKSCGGAWADGCTNLVTHTASGQPGWEGPYVDIPGVDVTVDKWTSGSDTRGTFFRLYAWLDSENASTTTLRLKGVTIWFHRQRSPAPGTATFGDVPTSHPFFAAVEALVASGVTSGCGGGNFCPDDPLTRGQMAVFLSKALGLHWPTL
jgi:hypothetical protein